MDNLNDITDDLLSLPGFVRRNLLLIRDLDLKSSSLFNEANKLSQSVFGTEHDLDNRTNSSFDKLSTISAPSSNVSFGSTTRQEAGFTKKEESNHSSKHDISSKKEDSPEHKSKSTKLKHDSDRSEKSDKSDKHPSSKLVSNKRRNSRDSMSSDNDTENLFFEHTKQFDEIQNLRMQGIYVLQEKIDVNSQITSMLKYEYENLKSKFDALYSEMELKGQIPHELKVYIASNKKKLQPLGTLEEMEGEGGAKKPEDKSIAHNQMDIATMFRNVINNQNNVKTTDRSDETEEPTNGKEGPGDPGSKLVNRQVQENQF